MVRCENAGLRPISGIFCPGERRAAARAARETPELELREGRRSSDRPAWTLGRRFTSHGSDNIRKPAGPVRNSGAFPHFLSANRIRASGHRCHPHPKKPPVRVQAPQTP